MLSANTPFIPNTRSATGHHYPVFSDILNTRLKPGKIEALTGGCTCLAGRFSGSADRPAEQWLSPKPGESGRPAHAAAFEIVVQVGEPEFATFEQTAVQRVMDNRAG